MKRMDGAAIVGLIFAFVGTIFFVTGTAVGLNLDASPELYTDGDMTFLVAMFVGMGGLFVVLGSIFVISWLRRSKHERTLVKRGVYTWAVVSDIIYDWAVTFNGAPGVRIVLTEEQSERQFEAGPVRQDAMSLGCRGACAKVYLGEQPDDYFVDLGSIPYDYYSRD